MRYKLILSSNVQPGPLWQQVVCVGRDAVQAGYGSVNFVAWLESYCPPEHLSEVRRCLQNDYSAYVVADDPFAARIYKVHPDTYASNSKMNHASVDVFEEKTITLTNGCQYLFHVPIPLKKP